MVMAGPKQVWSCPTSVRHLRSFVLVQWKIMLTYSEGLFSSCWQYLVYRLRDASAYSIGPWQNDVSLSKFKPYSEMALSEPQALHRKTVTDPGTQIGCRG